LRRYRSYSKPIGVLYIVIQRMMQDLVIFMEVLLLDILIS